MIQGTIQSCAAASAVLCEKTPRVAEPVRDADTSAESADWKTVHTELVRLAALRASLDWDEGRSQLAALRFGTHLKLGFGNFSEYVERLFGYRPKLTQEKLRIAEALEELPELDKALRDGVLCWSAVRELTRVATTHTEKAWIKAARGRTARDVEKLVSGRKAGDRPEDAAVPEAKRHTLPVRCHRVSTAVLGFTCGRRVPQRSAAHGFAAPRVPTRGADELAARLQRVQLPAGGPGLRAAAFESLRSVRRDFLEHRVELEKDAPAVSP
jgi:hypothetical protein